jgi:type IV pilus assembly protein PilV
MVAVLLLSIGLLGIAGLQAATAKYKINTWARSASATLLSEFVEKVRVNPGAAGPGFIDKILVDSEGASIVLPSKYRITDNWATQQSAALTASKNCETSSCTEQERSDYDMVTWRQRVRTLLPQGAAMVSGDKGNGIDLTLMWMDKEQTKEESGVRALKKAPVCAADTPVGMAQQSCCPSAANAPEGVRCARFFLTP